MEEYKIPGAILVKIPDYFWAAFAGELVAVFGLDFFARDEVDDTSPAEFLTGSAGWNYAFRATCDKLNTGWLSDYYDNLDWVESDMFDGDILDMVFEKFVSQNGEGTSPYYLHLVNELG